MFDDLDILDECYIKTRVHTADNELLNKINELYYNRKNKSITNICGGKIEFICENIKIENKENTFYIQFLDNTYQEKQDGIDSYIYSDNYKDSVIDLLDAMYNCGLVSMDACDLIGATRGRCFKNYRFKFNEPINESSINQILNTLDLANKIVLVNFYASSTLTLQEFDIIVDSLRQHNVNEDWYCADVKKELKNNERIISIYVEEK